MLRARCTHIRKRLHRPSIGCWNKKRCRPVERRPIKKVCLASEPLPLAVTYPMVLSQPCHLVTVFFLFWMGVSVGV